VEEAIALMEECVTVSTWKSCVLKMVLMTISASVANMMLAFIDEFHTSCASTHIFSVTLRGKLLGESTSGGQLSAIAKEGVSSVQLAEILATLVEGCRVGCDERRVDFVALVGLLASRSTSLTSRVGVSWMRAPRAS